jgi:hypothetical protein
MMCRGQPKGTPNYPKIELGFKVCLPISDCRILISLKPRPTLAVFDNQGFEHLDLFL